MQATLNWGRVAHSRESDLNDEEQEGDEPAEEDTTSSEESQQAGGDGQLSDVVDNYKTLDTITKELRDGSIRKPGWVRIAVSDIQRSVPTWAQIDLDIVEQLENELVSTQFPECVKPVKLPQIVMQMIEGSGALAVVSGFEAATAVHRAYAQSSTGWSVFVMVETVSEADAIIDAFKTRRQGRVTGNIDLLLYLDAFCLAIRPNVVAKNPQASELKIAGETMTEAVRVLKAKKIGFARGDFVKKLFVGRRKCELGTLGKMILDPSPTAPLRRFFRHVFEREQLRQVRVFNSFV